jgi:endonuclease III
LSQLRQLETLTDSIMLTVSEFFKEEKDPLYIRGAQKAQKETVKSLLKNTDFSTSKIAQIVGVSETFVEEVKGHKK